MKRSVVSVWTESLTSSCPVLTASVRSASTSGTLHNKHYYICARFYYIIAVAEHDDYINVCVLFDLRLLLNAKLNACCFLGSIYSTKAPFTVLFVKWLDGAAGAQLILLTKTKRPRVFQKTK